MRTLNFFRNFRLMTKYNIKDQEIAFKKSVQVASCKMNKLYIIIQEILYYSISMNRYFRLSWMKICWVWTILYGVFGWLVPWIKINAKLVELALLLNEMFTAFHMCFPDDCSLLLADRAKKNESDWIQQLVVNINLRKLSISK